MTTSEITEITAEEFDRKFEEGEDISDFVDWDKATRPMRKVQRVNVDFPTPMLAELDQEATRIGVTRQALIKVVIDQYLKKDTCGASEKDTPAACRKKREEELIPA